MSAINKNLQFRCQKTGPPCALFSKYVTTKRDFVYNATTAFHLHAYHPETHISTVWTHTSCKRKKNIKKSENINNFLDSSWQMEGGLAGASSGSKINFRRSKICVFVFLYFCFSFTGYEIYQVLDEVWIMFICRLIIVEATNLTAHRSGFDNFLVSGQFKHSKWFIA